MKSLCIAGFKLKEMTRDWGELLVPFIFPVVFISAFKLAFASTDGPMGIPFFDFLTPGMVVFALLMLAVGVSSSLAREVDKGTLTRLRLSNMTSFDLLFGVFLMWSVVGAFQAVTLFSVAAVLGFEWQGGALHLILAMCVGCLAAMASIAIGLLVASFAKSEGNAGAFSTLITVPVAFLVGSFMPMPLEKIADLLPWGQAIRCMRALLNAGAPINGLLPNILLMAGQIFVLLTLAVFVYSRARLRSE
jgi:ABC-2 type transport system permease protein